MKSEESGAGSLEEGSYAPPAKTKSIDGEDRHDGKYSKKESMEGIPSSSRYFKLAFCFFGLQVSYILWGLVQENLMTKDYGGAGKFKSSAFCVFGNRFLALLISLVIVMFNRIRQKKAVSDFSVPFVMAFAPSSLSNTISSWAQYEALKYISFPTQVLSKSCKIIPVMLVGILLHRKSYPHIEYIEATLITLSVSLFTFFEREAPLDSTHHDSSFGVSLLALYLVCDSFTSQWQSKVFKQYHIDQYQMMLGVNIWSMLMTAVNLYQSGEFFTSFAFILADSTALLHMVVLSITSATGQLFIFYTIKEFGAVVFTIMMTTRQVFSLFISLVLFGHTIGMVGWLSIVSVFGILFFRIYRGGKD